MAIHKRSSTPGALAVTRPLTYNITLSSLAALDRVPSPQRSDGQVLPNALTGVPEYIKGRPIPDPGKDAVYVFSEVSAATLTLDDPDLNSQALVLRNEGTEAITLQDSQAAPLVTIVAGGTADLLSSGGVWVNGGVGEGIAGGPAIRLGPTLTALLALGSDDGLAVGTVLWTASGEGLLVCDSVTATTSVWAAASTEAFSFAADASSTSLRFMDFTGVLEGGAANVISNQLAPGYAFRLEEISIATNNAAGASTVGVHKNGSQTPMDTATGYTALVLQGTLIVPSATLDFVALDTLGIGTTFTSSPGNVRGAVHIRRLYQ